MAEAEHLPTASKEAHISASALSRSVRLLEEDLGVELFGREGRQLELTTAGKRLLGATRAAMRSVESALDQILTTEGAGAVHVSAPGPYATLLVLPAFRKLRDEYPGIVPHVRATQPTQAERMLLDGALDIAISDRVEARPELRITKLGELGFSVYAGDTHPLSTRIDVTLDDLLAYPFVGPAESVSDHWPPHLPRKVGMVAEQIHVAMQACAAFELLALLPDVVAREYRGEGALVRLPVEVVTPRPLYAISRKAAAEPRRIDLVVRSLAHTMEDVRRGARRSSLPPARSTIRPPPYLEAGLVPPRPPGVPVGLESDAEGVPPTGWRGAGER